MSETIYNDNPGSLSVRVRSQIDETNWSEATTYIDGLGRTFKTQSKDSQGDVFTETQYDQYGRLWKVSNPYRVGETKLWTETVYDEAGRVKEVLSPTAQGQTAESKVTTEYGISTLTNFVGTYVVGTDQAGKKGRSITNALGQVIRVDEATGNNDLGSLESPNQPTFYTYNPQGQMVKVQQGNQNRYFLYDNLGRLLRVRQPEQDVNTDLNLYDPVTNNTGWTAAFTYDILGNMLTATDAKGVVITNTYDNANRVVTRSYTLPQTTDPKKTTFATPNVSYKYDGVGATIPFSKGKLTEVTNGISTTRYTSFDKFGRLLKSEQITDGVTYPSGYTYNMSGALVEQTYPSGRVVRNLFETDGDLSAISSRRNAINNFRTYASDFTYTASGVIDKLRVGNGLWESAKFNNNLQITELALGTSPTDTSLWKLNYEYGELDSNGNVITSKNNGGIARQTLNYQGLSNPFVQTFKYDSLDRLLEAKETTNGSQNWIQTFSYDRYGNRTGFGQTIGTTQLELNNLTFPSIDAATNRFNSNQGYEYDFNGNLIQDAENRKFSFNGDNKQAEVRDANNNSIGQYFYDADGKRVKKVSNTETTVFVYDGAGMLVAEYSNQQSQNPTTSYVVTDTLQSIRAITNQNGEVTSRRDFMPFGEELYAGTPNRTEGLKYSQSGSDNLRKRFTGYEKDTETGLDFAEARYYNNQHGRFTAVDPLLASGKSANPQTFNRYIYVMNSPLKYTDPSGMQAGKDPNKPMTDEELDEAGRCDDCPTYKTTIFASVKASLTSLANLLFGDSTRTTMSTMQTGGNANTVPKSNAEFFGRRTAGMAFRNWTNAQGQVNDIVKEWEPTGLFSLTDVTVRNSLGTASNSDVAWEYGKFSVNTGANLFGGTIFKSIGRGGSKLFGRFAFGTPSGKAIFWSGYPEAKVAALKYADITGGKTIEMTRGGRLLEFASPTIERFNPGLTNTLWDRASKHFASNASGRATVFQRFGYRSNSTWAQTERPILQQRGINFTTFYVKPTP